MQGELIYCDHDLGYSYLPNSVLSSYCPLDPPRLQSNGASADCASGNTTANPFSHRRSNLNPYSRNDPGYRLAIPAARHGAADDPSLQRSE